VLFVALGNLSASVSHIGHVTFRTSEIVYP
jgi:hypothetical protein